MIISVAGIRQFRRCQRQWAYDALLASAHSKDNSPRRELHLLSQIQSVATWRGNLVDQVITRRIVPALEKGWTLQPGAIAAFGRSLFLEQLEFARQNRMREPGMTKDKAGDTFVALSSIEYGGALIDADVEQAWADVETAVTNLLEMKDLLATLRRGQADGSTTPHVPPLPGQFLGRA